MTSRGILLLLLFAVGALQAQRTPAPPPYDPTPRLGILVPKGPPDYKLLLDALEQPRHVKDGSFDFQTGTISGVPVVLIIQPAPGEVLRALGAVAMIHDYNLRVLLYPGTSGAALPKGTMAPGDIVLGAKNVDHGNYYLAPDGHIEPGEFVGMQPGQPHVGPYFADPALLAMLACSATRVANATRLPRFAAPVRADTHPQIFYFGIQGTSTIWSDNKEYTAKTQAVFHQMDEDGDWFSNLAASLYGIPFLEVSTISNSIFTFPDAERGTPKGPAEEPNTHVMAQRISNRILLDLIANDGKRLMNGPYTNRVQSPYPESHFNDPRDPHDLLKSCPRTP